MTVTEVEAMLDAAAVLAADERREQPAEAHRRLDDYGLNAEFVPRSLGGRLTSPERAAEILRVLWRRDPVLGLGRGLCPFVAALAIGRGGTDRQQRTAAELLLAGHRITTTLGGRLAVDLPGSAAIVLPTDEGEYFLTRDAYSVDRFWRPVRVGSSGLCGTHLAEVEPGDRPLPGEALVAGAGAWSTRSLTGVVVPYVLVGTLDTALRTALVFARQRRLYGGTAADLPYVRSLIARALADLLCLDVLATAAIGALEAATAARSVAQYLASLLVPECFERLRSVLGAAGYLREGEFAIFQKLARDAAATLALTTSRAECLNAAPPSAAGTAHRRALLAAAAALSGSSDARLPEAARRAVLDRLSDGLGDGPVLSAPEREDVEEQLFALAVERLAEDRLFDLSARRTTC